MVHIFLVINYIIYLTEKSIQYFGSALKAATLDLCQQAVDKNLLWSTS